VAATIAERGSRDLLDDAEEFVDDQGDAGDEIGGEVDQGDRGHGGSSF
jgi:hypothetical protein